MRFWKGKAVWILAAVLLVAALAVAVEAVTRSDIARMKAKVEAREWLTADDIALVERINTTTGSYIDVNAAQTSAKNRMNGFVESPGRPRNPLDDYIWTPTTFNWVDISATGTPTGITADDGMAGPFNIGFNFPFYGSNYTQVWVNANGIVSFAALTTGLFTNVCIPATAAPNLAVYPFWDDMYLPDGGEIRYLSDVANNRFIVEWIAVPHITATGTLTAEAIIYPTGNVVFQYQNVLDAVNSCTIGIEDATGAQALQIACNGAGTMPSNGLAWLVGQLPGVPQAPTNLTGVPASGNVTLDWTNPTLDTQGNPVTVDSLVVWLGSVGGTRVARVMPPAHGYIHANSTPGSYTYLVTAYHGGNAGAPASVNVVVGSPTYNNNFDIDNGMWVADPPTGGWEWGAPTYATGPTPHSGANVWGTVLAGTYPLSACFNLTLSLGLAVASAQATVEFWGWYQIETNYDGCTFQVSTDQGATWNVVQPQGNYPGTTNTAQTCMPSTPAWTSSTVVPWTHYVIPIGQFNGQVVQFRFKFGSDPSVQYPGFYFDDMIIWGLTAPQTASVSGTVALNGGSGVVTNALVSANGLGSPSTHPAANGTYTLAGVQTGQRLIYTTLAGYDTAMLNVNLPVGGLTNQNMTIRRLPPPAPTGLVSNLNSTTGRDSLAWVVSPDLLVDGYKLYDRMRDSTIWRFRKTVYGRTHNYGIDTLTQAGIWSYAVTAIDTGVTGGAASPVESPKSDPTPPEVFGNLPPVALTANGNFDNKIQLNWLAPGTPPSHELYYDSAAVDPTCIQDGLGFTSQFPFGWFAAHYQVTGPVTILRVKTTSWPQSTPGCPIQMGVFEDAGGGIPTLTPLSATDATITDPTGWTDIALSSPVTVQNGSFFAAIRQVTAQRVDIGMDFCATQHPNTFFAVTQTAGPWDELGGAGFPQVLAIRCIVQGGGGEPTEIELQPTPVARGPVAEGNLAGNWPVAKVSEKKTAAPAAFNTASGHHATPIVTQVSNYVGSTIYYPADDNHRGRNPLDLVTKYIIFRDGARRDSVAGTVLTYNDTPLPENQTHQYYVKALYDNVSLSDPSNTVSAACNNPPSAPPIVNCDPVGTTQARISWTAPTTNADGTPCTDLAGYYIYRDDAQIGQVPAGTTEHISTPPSVSTFYTYTVKAYDEVPNIGEGGSVICAVQSPWVPIPLNWVDISGNGTATGITADDGAGGPWSLGFSFTFYGGTYTQVYANSNGMISFASLTTGLYTNSCIPSTAVPNCTLYPFWDDLDPSSAGTIKYYADAANHRFIIAWLGVEMYNTGEPVTFEVIIDENGSVTFNYQTMATNNECTVGVENCDGTDALQLVCDGDGPFLPTSGTAVQFWGGPTSGITGIVRAFSPSIPIQSVKVWVTGQQDTTVTDAGGSYSIGIEPGTYTVNFRHTQYCDTTYAGVVVVENTMTTRNATMRSAVAAFSVTSINRTIGVNLTATDSFSVDNTGGPCALNFTVADSATWISESPVVGSVPAGGRAYIRYTYGPFATTGINQSSIMVYYTNAPGSPYRIPVTIQALTAEEPGAGLPTEFALHQNYPNPFNASTSISFDVPRDSRVDIVIYNMMGQEVAHPVSSVYATGRHQVIYDATNLPTGTYVIKMTAGEFSQLSKMLLLK